MSNIIRTTGQITGLSLIVAPLALVGQSAFATANCGTTTPAATLVAPGVCGVEFTEAGDYTFTAPAGITKLHAVLVGGGAASYQDNGMYGGGGGDVQFLDITDYDQAVEITVGAGGEYSNGSGDDTIVNGTIVSGGNGTESGNGNDPAVDPYYDEFAAGAGAAGDAPARDVPGPGILASEVAGDSVLFPEIDGEVELGAGGDSIVAYATTIDHNPLDPGHGGAAYSDSDGDDGVDGAVFLRWAEFTDTLPNTGFDSTNALFAGASIMAGGAILVATRRRGSRA